MLAVTPAPLEFGRGVIIADGATPPEPWRNCPVIRIDRAVLDTPGAVIDALHAAWSTRQPIVVDLHVDPATFRDPVSLEVEPWRLEPAFEMSLDRLHFLVWANNYDARTGEVIWWWSNKAMRLGALPAVHGSAGDARLPDGRHAWVDGGPRGTVPAGAGPVVHADSIEAGRLNVARHELMRGVDLAPDQLTAVTSTGTAARVIAPAGSGKTRVLTERLRYVVERGGYERSSTLAVAYNVRARDEMVARTSSFTPRVVTLNGLGYDVLAVAGGKAPRVLDEREVRRIIDGLAPAKRQRRANTDPIGPYIEALGTVRLALRDPAAVEAERDDVPGFAAMFDPYRDALIQRGAVDFDEQIYRAIELLLGDGPLRRSMQMRARHVLVDEFQDLTPAHVLLIRLLVAPGFDVFGVGDDDQVIYGHAGADPRFLVDFDRLFPGAAHHALETNYRCPAAVVDAARSLLSCNAIRVDKTILAGPGVVTGDDALDVRAVAGEAMVAESARLVGGWISDDGVGARDIAVLARVNAALLGPAVALTDAGIPVHTQLGVEVLDRLGIRAALAYLRLATAGEAMDREDLVEIYRRPSRGLPEWITKWFRAPMSVARLRGVARKIDDGKVSDKIEDLADDLAALVSLAGAGASTADLLRAVRTQVGLGDAMAQLDRSRGDAAGGSSQLDDLIALEQVAALQPDPGRFEPWLRSVLRRPPDVDGVVVATVHKVKGQEWARVVVFGATDGLMPHRLSENVEEERRVLHVAITRGAERVVVLADAARPSPFLAEMRGERGPAPRTQAKAPIEGGVRTVRAGPVEPVEPVDGALFEALRAWRLDVARSSAVAPFVVFHDRVLREIARLRPADERALRRIAGVGPAKIERYGAAVLAIVNSGPAGSGV
jgi:DNA helicase-2/ATP-dependent DNA helicase PcrA